jgi:heme/copper-type cytochrome/quinol oxidase subunit 2
LGVAEDNAVDELVKELEAEVVKIKGLQSNIKDSVAVWKKNHDYMVSTGLSRTYPEEYKTVKTKYTDGISGAYERTLEKDLKRKMTNLSRIVEYKKDRTFFDGSAKDDKITTEIVLVKNKPYVFKFRARDVIHSAYMPDFRVQMNCVPGMPTQFAFTPTMTTEETRKSRNNAEYDYYLFCNKICGGAHYNMKIKVTVVESEAEYNTWMASQAPFVAPVAVPAPAGAAPSGDSAAVAPVTPTVAMK